MPKAKSIYIFGTEPQAGKSVVLLGIMELLSRHVQKLGFFRPLVREGETRDDAIRLISSRCHLTFPNRIKYGMTYERARSLVGEEKYDEVLKRILEEYRSLESECNVVVCLGTGFHDIPPGLALDFNIDVFIEDEKLIEKILQLSDLLPIPPVPATHSEGGRPAVPNESDHLF